MGICGAKPKEQKGAKKNNADKYYEKETNDNNHADLEEYTIPPDFESKLEFLCSQKLNKHLRMRSSDTSFFYKVIVESNITSPVDLEKGITYLREKIKQKNEQIMRNVDNKGSTCIQTISEYYSKIKDYDFKGLLAMMLQEKCQDNEIPPLLEKVFSISIRCYQIVLSILLSNDQESIEKWWNINKDNNNITEEFFGEIKDLNKSLSLKNEQYQQMISMLVSRRQTKETGFLTDEQIKKANQQFAQSYTITNDEIIKEVVKGYLPNLYSDVYKHLEKNNQNKSTQEGAPPQVLKDYVSSYLSKLYERTYVELEFIENITDNDIEQNHVASTCVNYTLDMNFKKKQMYFSRKD